MDKIEYKKEFLDLLRDLSILVPGMILYKEDDRLFIFRKNVSDIYYRLSVPVEYLNFAGDYLAIRDFGEFYSFIKTMSEPEFFDLDSHILVKDHTSQIKYPTTDEDPFLMELDKLRKKDDSWKNINFTDEPAFICNFDKNIVKEIKTVAGRINNEFVTLTVKDNELTINCFISEEYPSWQKVYKSDIKNDIECSFKIYTDVFNFLPLGIFQFKIDGDGCVKLELDHEDIKLEIIAAEAGS